MLEGREIFVGYVKEIDILQGVTFVARKNQITAILGTNGVGKSTLLRTIFGFLTPNKGKIFFENEDITGLSPYKILRKGICYVPQRRNVFPDLSVEQNLLLGGWILDKEIKKRKVYESFQRFPILEQKKNSKAGLLSGGQQRMLEIGRALMIDPHLILLDEPTAGLAPKVVGEVYAYLTKLKEESKTIVLVDQNIRQAVEISDYVYVLELGRNKIEGARDQFRDLVGKFWSHALE